MNNYGRFSEETRARVLAAAEQLGYRPNQLARSMITRRTNILGVVCADISSPFFAGVVRGITDQARADGYRTLLINTDEDVSSEREAVQVLLETQVDGIIVSTADAQNVEHLKEVQAKGKPLVLIDRPSSAIAADIVAVDDTAATEAAVRHLLQLGHRRVGIVTELRVEREANWANLFGADLDVDRGLLNASAARLLGYLRAHRREGIDVDPRLIGRTGTYSAADATAATQALLTRPDRPTALVTIDNTMTVGAIQAIRDLAISMPEELSFVGFDNLDWTTLMKPALTVIEQPVHEIGREAAAMLIRRIAGDDTPPRTRMLPTKLLLRESTASPKAAARH